MKTLIPILLIAGFLVLLSAIFGRRLRLRPVGVIKIPVWVRLSTGSLILLLAGCGSLRPAASPPPSVATPAAVLPTTGLAGSQAPVIEAIQTSLTSTSFGAIIQADIHFHDPDGDADEIAYTVVGSSVPGVTVAPEPVTVASAEQIAGTNQILEWPCQGSSAIVSLKAVILDKAGHRSNIFPFVLDCG
jgi:hypothetical protein